VASSSASSPRHCSSSAVSGLRPRGRHLIGLGGVSQFDPVPPRPFAHCGLPACAHQQALRVPERVSIVISPLAIDQSDRDSKQQAPDRCWGIRVLREAPRCKCGKYQGAPLSWRQANNEPAWPGARRRAICRNKTAADRARPYSSDRPMLRLIAIPQLGHRYSTSSVGSLNIVGTIVLILIGPSQRGHRGAVRAATRAPSLHGFPLEPSRAPTGGREQRSPSNRTPVGR
jgi:hypothetical protein